MACVAGAACLPRAVTDLPFAGTDTSGRHSASRFAPSDKTACSRWEANQLRLFLHSGAYWLLHALHRAAPKRLRWRGATLELWRTFVKIAVCLDMPPPGFHVLHCGRKLALPCRTYARCRRTTAISNPKS
jgi:Transposase DDE domain group 1